MSNKVCVITGGGSGSSPLIGYFRAALGVLLGVGMPPLR
jgi:hypothetical protein